MTEIPRAPGGVMYAACRFCPARIDFEICDETKFDKFSDNLKVAKYRPHDCPLPHGEASEAISQSLLRRQLKHQGK